jgi:hypothetical protein
LSSSQRAAELRALADQHDTIGGLEETHAAAVEAYRADPSDTTKAAYAEASDALRAGRQELRSSGLMVGSSELGSVTIGVRAANAKVG